MSVSREELIKFLEEAESRGDMETANRVLDKIEAMGAETGDTQPGSPPKFQPEPWTPNSMPDAGINPIAGNAEAILQGGSFGLSDEVQAGISAIPSLPDSDITGKGPSYLQRYQEQLAKIRGNLDQFRQQEGAAAYVPELAGGMAMGLSGLARPNSLWGAAGVGALEGAIGGAGYADADEFLSPETAASAGMSAGIGAVAGPAITVGGRMLKKAGGAVADAVADRFPNLSGRAGKILAEEAATGSRPDMGARYILKRTPKGGATASRDSLAIRAIDQMDIPEATVNTLKQMSPTDKKAAKQMINIIKIGKGNSAFADANRAGDVLGKTLKDKVDFISAQRVKAGKQLDSLVKTKLKGQPVAVDDALQSFAEKLDAEGVVLNQSKTGKITVDFDGALRLNKRDRGPIKEAIRKINRVLESGRPTAEVVHDLKKALDNEIPWDQASKMTREGEGLLQSLRHDLNVALQETFPGYKEINGVLQQTIGTMNDLAESVGRRYDPNKAGADEYLGQELRKLATNYNVRIDLKNALKRVEEVSTNLGMQSDANVFRQATMVNDLEDLFGPAARRGFRAEVQKGTADALADTAKRSIRGEKGAFVDRAIDTISDATSNVDDEKRMGILLQLLSRE